MNQELLLALHNVGAVACTLAAISLAAQYFIGGRSQSTSYRVLAMAVFAALAALVVLRLSDLLYLSKAPSLPVILSQLLTDLVLVMAAVVHPWVRKTAQRRRFADLQVINQQLLHRKGLFDAFMREVPGVVVIKKPDGQMLYVNDYLQRLFGIDPASIVGKYQFPFDSAETVAVIREQDQEVLRTGKRSDITQKVSLNNIERTVTMSKFRIELSPGNALLGGIGIDITDELDRKSRIDGLASVIELSPDPVYCYLEDGTVTFWNSAAEKVFGYGRQEIVGHSIEPLVPEERKAEFQSMIQRLRDNGEVRNLETVRVTKSGERKEVILSACRTVDADGKMLCALMVRDVSRQKEMERQVVILNEELTQRIKELSRTNSSLEQARDEALRASTVKSAFVANISHELRTPLGGILGMSELALKEEAPTDDQKHMLELIHHSANALLQLVNEILDMSKLEAGKMKVEPELFSPVEMVQQCISLVQPAAMNKHLTIKLEAACDLPELLNGDSGKVRQVTLILLSNAVKFTRMGAIKVAMSVERRDHGPNLLIKIIDTGIGIPAADTNKIFAPFSSMSTPWRAEGLGLGLALAKRFVELMNGEIGFQSLEGKGSTFWFKVPYEHTAKQPVSTELPSPTTADGDLPPCCVLSVEDNAVLSRLTVRQLKLIGATADTAKTAAEAIEKAASGKFDIILMDVHLPDGSGYDAACKIRAAQKSTDRKTQIIAMTAGSTPAEHQAALDAGMDDFLAKPVTVDSLRQAVDSALKRQRSNS